jgi:hypothetical protein
MLFSVMFPRLVGVMASVGRVAVGHVRVMAALLVTASIVMFGRFAVMPSGVLMMLCRFGMMVSALMLHGLPPRGCVGASALSQFDDASTTGVYVLGRGEGRRRKGK